MKKTTKKLRLDTATVRYLQSSDLDTAGGGIGSSLCLMGCAPPPTSYTRLVTNCQQCP